jgi:hypothetical protein
MRWADLRERALPQELATELDAQKVACAKILSSRERLMATLSEELKLKDEEYLEYIKSFNLQMPHDERGKRPKKLNEKELEIVQENIDKVEERAVDNVVITPGDYAEKDPRAEMLRENLHADYDEVVLRDEVLKDPPRER